MKKVTMLAAIMAMTGGLIVHSGAALAAEPPKTKEAKVSDQIANDMAARKAAADLAQQELKDMADAEERRQKAEEEKEARRLAAAQKEKERKARDDAWAARCVIKAAMSDEEIAICREVRSTPAPAR